MCFVLMFNKRQRTNGWAAKKPSAALMITRLSPPSSASCIHAHTIYNNRHHRRINRNDTQKVGYMGVPYERGVEMTQHFQSVTVRNAVSGWWSGGGWSNIEGGGRER